MTVQMANHYDIDASTVVTRALDIASSAEPANYENAIFLLMESSDMNRDTAADILAGRAIASCVDSHLYVVYPDAAPANALHVVFGS